MKINILLILTILFSGVSSFATYCTLWNESNWGHAGRPPIGLTCMQSDGSWKNIGGFPEAPTTNPEKDYYGSASLAEAANGDVLMSYERELFKPNSNTETEMMVARYNSKAGWGLVSSTPVNSEAGKNLPHFNQFGAQIFELLGVPVVFWSQGEMGAVSNPVGNSWRHIRFSLPNINESGFRYPQALMSATGGLSYLYYAEPTPIIWSFDGTQITPIPSPQVDQKKEYTLHASLAEWNGQLALAYSSSNMPLKGNWETSVNKTKVAFFNGSSWRNVSSGVEDTPGRDQLVPFLFTVGKNLYIMYEDFSTDGVPEPQKEIAFRLRVKQWTGLRWKKVGSESDQANYSTRLEFLNDNGTVLINLIQKAPIGGYRQVVMSWKNGKFGILGKQIRSLPNLTYRPTYRPGAVVRLNN